MTNETLAETMDWSEVGSAGGDALLMESLANLSSPIAMAVELRRQQEKLILQAKRAFIEGNQGRMLSVVKQDWRWDFLNKNAAQLQQRGMFEACLLVAHLSTFSNWTKEQGETIRRLFSLANRGRLRAAGNLLPSDGPFTLYRGVCNDEGQDGMVGWSWTDRLDAAKFFAMQFSKFVAKWSDSKPRIAVLKATIETDEVLAYIGGPEREFIAQPSSFEPIPVEFDWTWTAKSVFGAELHDMPDRVDWFTPKPTL